MKIVFCGGGTAGHIFPIVAIIREIKKQNIIKDVKLFYIGPKDDFVEKILSKEGVKINKILAGKIRRYFGLKSLFMNFIDIFFKTPIGFLQSLFYIFFIFPDAIFSKGGYGSFPVVFSGWLLLVPVFLHESDTVPGLVNRLMSNFAVDIFISFPIEKSNYFKRKRVISVGNPIRTEILNGKKEEAKKFFKLTDKPVILVLGGSQGSQRINDVILTILPNLLSNFELIHQTGIKNFKEIENEAKLITTEEIIKFYHPYPFIEEETLKQAYAAADLIISRSGSGTIFEIASVKKPSILIPLPESAQKHQVQNAYAFAQTGAALVIEEDNLTPNFLLDRIKYLLSRKDRIKKMQESAALFAKPQAAKIITEYILEYLKQ